MSPEEISEETMSSKKAAELISNWYQAYYSWQLGYMASMTAAVTSPPLHAYPKHLINHDRHPNPHPAPRVEQRAAPVSAAVPPATGEPIEYISVPYRVPSLFKRFLAECIDTVYIQVIKIFVALIFINAEWMSVFM
jgi:hypothetical protein